MNCCGDRMNKEDIIGIILSSANTSEAVCQLLEEAEGGAIREGSLVAVETSPRKILARVSKIVPYNAFYTEGDAWSEARRKGMLIPEEVARKYETVHLELLMEIPGGKEVKYPPKPSTAVVRIRSREHLKDIFGIDTDHPGYIWIGRIIGSEDAPVPLKIKAIPMHFSVFGVTGSGKSYDTGCLIESLSNIPTATPCGRHGNRVAFPMILIDAHGDYMDYVSSFKENRKFGAFGWIERLVFPRALASIKLRNEFEGVIGSVGIDLDLFDRRDLAETIVYFYKGTTDVSELQVTGIENLFEIMLDRKSGEYGDSVQNLFIYHFDDILETLDSPEVRIHPSARGAVERALRKFHRLEEEHNLLTVESSLKDTDLINRLTGNPSDHGLLIIDFSAEGAPGIDLPVKQTVMSYLASRLLSEFADLKVRGDDRNLIFAIEEAQNFCPDRSFPIGNSLAKSKLTAIATQGRKFGVSLCLISQRPSFVDRIILSMCNSFFIHRVSPGDVSFVNSATGGLPSSIASKITTLGQGEMIVSGQMLPVPFPIMCDMRDQRTVDHKAGSVRVMENLTRRSDL